MRVPSLRVSYLFAVSPQNEQPNLRTCRSRHMSQNCHDQILRGQAFLAMRGTADLPLSFCRSPGTETRQQLMQLLSLVGLSVWTTGDLITAANSARPLAVFFHFLYCTHRSTTELWLLESASPHDMNSVSAAGHSKTKSRKQPLQMGLRRS